MTDGKVSPYLVPEEPPKNLRASGKAYQELERRSGAVNIQIKKQDSVPGTNGFAKGRDRSFPRTTRSWWLRTFVPALFASPIFVLWANLQVSAESFSAKIKRFSEGETDTIISFKSAAHTILFFAGGRCLVFQRFGLQDTRLSYVEADRGTVWSKTYSILVLYDRLVSGENGIPKELVGYEVNEGQCITEVLDNKGNRLAGIEDNVFVDASPNGIFFYSQTEIYAGANNLNVYDSLGNLLWSKAPFKNYWLAAALSDSLLVYLDRKTLQILYAKNGAPRFEEPGDLYSQDENLLGKLITSKNGKYFILRGRSTLFSFSLENGCLWSTTFDKSREFLGDAAISPDGKFVLVLTVPRGSRGLRELRLMKNWEHGRQVWSVDYQTNTLFRGADYSSLDFAFDSLVTALVPSGNDVYGEGLAPTTTTKYFYLDSQSGTVIDTGTVNGLLHAYSNRATGTGFALGRFKAGSPLLFFKRNPNDGKK